MKTIKYENCKSIKYEIDNIKIYNYHNIQIYNYHIITICKTYSPDHICDHRERTARTFLYDKNTSCNILPTLLPDVVRSSVYWESRLKHTPCLMTIFVYLIS